MSISLFEAFCYEKKIDFFYIFCVVLLICLMKITFFRIASAFDIKDTSYYVLIHQSEIKINLISFFFFIFKLNNLIFQVVFPCFFLFLYPLYLHIILWFSYWSVVCICMYMCMCVYVYILIIFTLWWKLF